MEQFKTSYYCTLGQHGVATHHATYQMSTGYGIHKDDSKSCFECIGKQDRLDMLSAPIGSKHFGYLTKESNGYHFSNWCGTLKVKCFYQTESRTNWNLRRLDAWFILVDDQGTKHYFWLKQIGDNNQCAYVRKVKPF